MPAASTPKGPFHRDRLATLRANPPGVRKDIRDDDFPGLDLRLHEAPDASGRTVATWSLRYKRPGTRDSARHDLGEWPDLTASAAWEAAKAWKVKIKAGVDPKAEKMARLAAAEAKAEAAARVVTFRTLADSFVEKYARRRKASWQNDERNLRRPIAAWGTRPAASITRREVAAFLDDLAAEYPVAANRHHATLSKLFHWAVDSGILDASPMVKLAKRGTENTKDRLVTAEELRRLWAVVEGAALPAVVDCWRFQWLTGLRPGEAAALRWEYVKDLDGTDPRLEIPAKAMKARRAHSVPLVGRALEIVRRRAAADDRTAAGIFASKYARRESIATATLSRLLHRVVTSLPEGDTLRQSPPTPHDGRRLVTSELARLGIAAETRKAILGHVDSSVMARHYDRHDGLDAKRAALALWDRRVSEILDGPAAGNVVTMRRPA